MNRLTQYYEAPDPADSRYLASEELKEESKNQCSGLGNRVGNSIEKVFNKLGMLEDIEEELGCPLEILFKVLMNKEIYFVTDKLECSKNLHCYISLDTNTCLENEMCIDICIDEPKHCREENVYLYLKDYKKTWWLREDKSE